MEEKDNIMLSINNYCLSCLCKNHETFEVKSRDLRTIFQVDRIPLCYICSRVAQHAEVFIQNVQKNQALLENLLDVTGMTGKTTTHPIINLSQVSLNPICLDGVDDSSNDNDTMVCESNSNVEVKIEFKFENGSGDDYDDDICHGNDDGRELELKDFENSVKEEEDEYPLTLLKREGIEIKSAKANIKKVKTRKKLKDKAEQARLGSELSDDRIQYLRLTKEECLQERSEKLLEEAYLNAEYKCEDCVKWFSYKSTYEKHMENHDEIKGDYVCEICKQRRSTESKMLIHKRYHIQRYKCLECGLTRLNRLTIEDHYRSKHLSGLQFSCPYCSKGFRRKVSLKKHIRRVHWVKEKVVCAHCNKLYASKETLKTHIVRRHSLESGRRVRKHVCPDCDKAFESPSQLKNHSIKHTHRKDYYCVECDKSFKSNYILLHHLKTAMFHNNYKDLPLPCVRCDKRFAVSRDLVRHVNRVHLNIKPFQCDRCEKAYVNSWSLKEHQRLIHEGYKRPLKFPCTMCDKVFDRNAILKSHIRTHTGERPYQCTKCPAAFSQSGILGTHDKLVHRKLTRDGRPKSGAHVK